ncbi:hypothetical protein A7979_00230 [Rothia nasimurium]|uniref:DUF3054 domain-containing protein n=1 Tax=Rothia nasimurium TaxID=85336 RepID=A0A1Y1RQB4_9MICC|nr:DUF3054 domain-containing protein [Rothia nasimurium]ORC21987.1 hypothetical protein A7979_00230 [Rothia nasimurium]
MTTSTKRFVSLPQPIRMLLDVGLVLVFIAIGLRSHHEPLGQILPTATPFLLALAAAHLGVWAVGSRRALPLLLEGFMVWVTTLVLGIGLRLSMGDTAATAFIVVSALTLLVLLCGWRIVALLVARRR